MARHGDDGAGKATSPETAADEPGVLGVGHSDEKARQILDGAREVFRRDGYDGASMNDVARAAGVSKGTLYAYWPSKEQLFIALVRHDKRQQAERGCLWSERGGEAADATLARIGRTMIAMLLRPEHLAQVRTVMAVAPKVPAVGSAFYEAGPLYGTTRLAALLDQLVAAGQLEIPDTRLAAVQFMQLCQADFFRRLMFCVGEAPTAEEIDVAVGSAVEVFTRAYARR